jgi:hypothetical protein
VRPRQNLPHPRPEFISRLSRHAPADERGPVALTAHARMDRTRGGGIGRLGLTWHLAAASSDYKSVARSAIRLRNASGAPERGSKSIAGGFGFASGKGAKLSPAPALNWSEGFEGAPRPTLARPRSQGSPTAPRNRPKDALLRLSATRQPSRSKSAHKPIYAPAMKGTP